MIEDGYNLEKTLCDESSYFSDKYINDNESTYDDQQIEESYEYKDHFKKFTNPLYNDTDSDDEMIYCHSVPDKDLYVFPNPLYEKEFF